jgi:hypothetical protein
MRWLPALMVSVLLLAASRSPAQQANVKTGAAQKDNPPAAWEVDLRRRHDALIQANGAGTDAALRERLLAMVAKDQDARGFRDGAPKDKKKLVMAANLNEIDAALTAELKEVVAAHGWPTIALAGIDASNGAMLILTHSRDHAWQLALLPQLEQLADDGKIDGSSVATVVDKELVSEGKLQRYGTQFKLVSGGMAMFAVEDPGGLDARRERVFLPPMEVYRQVLSEMYHLKATNQIVMATPPAKTPEAKQP